MVQVDVLFHFIVCVGVNIHFRVHFELDPRWLAMQRPVNLDDYFGGNKTKGEGDPTIKYKSIDWTLWQHKFKTSGKVKKNLLLRPLKLLVIAS